ncbi:hypothetical protein EYF80_046225 [Liparis tanakae]|uniref:Uncharacterized protein n=1 Tax=Liparis tanakae TaxID=230148 RepID=A0A4Z2FT43_9TELE|nr:hypothetical protein EYF80_046225 [Liparis tanakae]
MVEISLSNMAWTVLVWTRVRRGDSLACMHRNSRQWLTLSTYWPRHASSSSGPCVVSHFFRAISISSEGMQDVGTFRLAESCKTRRGGIEKPEQ